MMFGAQLCLENPLILTPSSADGHPAQVCPHCCLMLLQIGNYIKAAPAVKQEKLGNPQEVDSNDYIKASSHLLPAILICC